MARKIKPIKHEMIEMSEGVRIGSGFNVRPAPYLPIKVVDTEKDVGIVIKRGTIVTFDDNGYLIPCTGGATVAPTYTSIDEQYEVINIDDDAVVESGDIGTASGSYDTNAPVGIAQYDIYQYSPTNHDKYRVQDHVAILEDYLVLYELSSDNAAWVPGATVIPDGEGYPTPLEDTFLTGTDVAGVQTDILKVMKYKVGRVVRKVNTANDVDNDFMGGYDKVKVVPGLGLHDGAVTGINESTGLGVLIQLQF